ncbi:hypothetical protein ARMGADRAFT_1076049 [Armillaria gallica]|uniref:Uncharacterized protein n=1 Tax=Armillaria gallica TaxID=47427 RepID=A0A2H3DUM5_ARMGA|nr:hypothetical protein ARMGADRAFT_1076049 [Armillaria gallica]
MEPAWLPAWLMRTATPVLTATQDPLNKPEDFQTPTPSPIHSPTHTPTDQLMIPSIAEETTTSGPSLVRLTERYSAPTKPLPGNSNDKTLSNDSSGPMLANPESIWTSTSPSTAETCSSVNRPTPAWLHGYMPTVPGANIHQPQGTEYLTPNHEPPQSRYASRPTYVPSPSFMRSGWANRNFEFQLDKETFGDAI